MGLFFESADTVDKGVLLLRIFALAFPGLAVYLMIEEIHLGVGLNTPIMVFSIIHSWFLQVLPIFLITSVLNMGEIAVWWVLTISECLTAAAIFVYYRRGRWLTVSV